MKIPYIDIHTHNQSLSAVGVSIRNIFLHEFPPKGEAGQCYSSAIHPWHGAQFSPEQIEELFNRLQENASMLSAIGETGLDKTSPVPLTRQITIFQQHIKLAERLKLPLIIHNVKAWDEIYALQKESQIPWILHGFSGNARQIEQFTARGFYLSLGANILKQHHTIARCFEQIPLERLFLETDESGHSIVELYQFVASKHNISIEELKRSIFVNFQKVFTENLLTE